MMEWRNKMFSLLYLVPCRRRPILENNIAYTKQALGEGGGSIAILGWDLEWLDLRQA
jgi:hypothetical protein